MFHLRDQTKSTWEPNKDRDKENTLIEAIDNNVENLLTKETRFQNQTSASRKKKL